MTLFGGKPLDRLSMSALDQLMVRYMEYLFRSGEMVTEARYVLFGVVFELDLVAWSAETLPLAKRTLKGFARRAPEPSRDPPPLDLIWLLAHHFFHNVGGAVGLQASVFVLLAVDGYLRPSEALALRREDFHVLTHGNDATWSVTVAPSTRGAPAKNREYDDGFTVGAYDRGFMNRLISLFVQNISANEHVFPSLTLTQLEKLFKVFAGREHMVLSPHSLRHAGPSHDMLHNGASMHDAQWRGRWLCLESRRRYSKPAKLHRQQACLTESQLERARLARESLPKELMCELSRAVPKSRRFGDSCSR